MNIAAAFRLGILRGLGETEKRCAQCWRLRPTGDFVGARGDLIARCADCQARYGNWTARSPEERARARRPVRRTGDGYTVRFTLRSQNRKTGPIPVSTTAMRSCPASCPHMDQGCYAGYGNLGALWREVAETGLDWDVFCARVARLPPGTLWRHNDAGDLPGVGNDLDVRALDELVVANAGRRGFSFTHKPLLSERERDAIARANAAGFTVNLSADSLREADALADLGVAPVAVVLEAGARSAGRTPAGRKVVVCPAVTHAMTCSTCGLCAKPRQAIVGFPAHGQAAALVSLRVRGAR